MAGSPSDIWASADGINWNEQVPSTPWLSRVSAVVKEFNGELWVLGGGASGTNHVWRTADGKSWTQEVNAPWLERVASAGVVFKGKLWIFGGSTLQPPFKYPLNDVWSTPDGVNWTQEVAAANWSARSGHTAAVFNNRMWIIGSYNHQKDSDIWSSVDGINWTLEVASAPWGPRFGHATVVYRNRIWVIGGTYEDSLGGDLYYDDAWSSLDGVNWVQEITGAPWGLRSAHSTAVFKNRIWLTGGRTNEYKSDVWSYGLHIAPEVLPDGEVNMPYNAALTAREGDGPFIWSMVGGTLPSGLTIDFVSTSDTAAIAGTPTEVGTFAFTIKLEDADGYTAEQLITLRISLPPPLHESLRTSNGSGCAPQPTPQLPAAILVAAALTAHLKRRRKHTAA